MADDKIPEWAVNEARALAERFANDVMAPALWAVSQRTTRDSLHKIATANMQIETMRAERDERQARLDAIAHELRQLGRAVLALDPSLSLDARVRLLVERATTLRAYLLDCVAWLNRLKGRQDDVGTRARLEDFMRRVKDVLGG